MEKVRRRDVRRLRKSAIDKRRDQTSLRLVLGEKEEHV